MGTPCSAQEGEESSTDQVTENKSCAHLDVVHVAERLMPSVLVVLCVFADVGVLRLMALVALEVDDVYRTRAHCYVQAVICG
jgi:uncharacterized membrane protein YqjE